MATFDHGVPPAAGPLRLPAGADRITPVAMKVLAAALAAVYAFSAATMPGGRGSVAAGEAAIAAAQLGWIVLVSARPGRAWVYRTGVVLQLALTALWIVTRTAALPGIGRLPVGEFDLLCAADALVIAALCLWGRAGASPGRAGASPGRRLGLCQLAVILAAGTIYMSMASMMAMAAAAPSPARTAGGPATHGGAAQGAPRYFCHLL